MGSSWRSFQWLALAGFSLALTLGAEAQQKLDIAPRATVAIRDARLVTVSGETIERGTLVIRDGRIAAIGASAPIPAGAQILDGKGLTVYPGMIDAGTSLGLVEIPAVAATVDQGEVGDYNPNARALVAINPHSAHVRVTRYNGITNVATMPDGGVICGQATFINLYGTSPQEMAVVPSLGLVVNFPRLNVGGGGPFAAFRQPPPANIAEAIAARNRRVEELRQVLREAADYGRAKAAAASDPKIPRPATNVVYESLLPTLRGETPVFFRADRAQDIRAVLAFAEDMGLRPIIVGGNEAWVCAAELKAKNVPVILTGVLDLPNREDDPYDVLYENAAKLHQAGVRFCISTGDNGAHVRDLPYHAGMAAAFGLDPKVALRAVTLSAAEVLGVSDRVGSLEVGKMANVVVADGDLLEPRTRVKYAFIDGRPAQLTSRHTELYEQFKERK
ncbi:MAG: amidohydrolase family protein [Chloracidobacterium sp.]